MFIFLLISVISILVILRSDALAARIVSTKCEKQHKWIVSYTTSADKKGYLICENCGKIPGDD